MRKFYLLALVALLSLNMSAQKDVLLVGDYDSLAWINYITPLKGMIEAYDGITVHDLTLDSVTNADFVWSVYDGIVISELGGSSALKVLGVSPGLGDSIIADIPVMNMKAYAIHDGKSAWDWVASADFYGKSALFDTADVAAATEVEILTDHDIFGDGDIVGLEEGATFHLYDSIWDYDDTPHLQSFSFENSAVTEVADEVEELMMSTVLDTATLDGGPTSSTIMVAIEANSVSARNVIWGVHAKWCKPTTELKTIMSRSVLWILGMDDVLTSNKSTLADETSVSIYPNPASDVIKIKANSNVAVTLHDVTGKLVYSDSFAQSAVEINVSDLAQGIYVCTVVANNVASTQRIVIE